MRNKKEDIVEPSRFFIDFAGEMIMAILDVIGSQPIPAEDGSIVDVQTPLTVQGYLIDEDDNFYYLGDDGQKATKVVKKERVVYVQLASSEIEQIEESYNGDPSQFN